MVKAAPSLHKTFKTLLNYVVKVGKTYLELRLPPWIRTWNGSLTSEEVDWAVALYFKNKINYRKGKRLTVELYDIPYSSTELILMDYYELEGVQIIKIHGAVVISSHKEDIILHSKIIEVYCWILNGSKTIFELEINKKPCLKRPYEYNEILSDLLSSNGLRICTIIKVRNFDTQSFFVNGTRNGKSVEKNRIIV